MTIGFISHIDWNLYIFRLPMMVELVKRGHTVYAIVPTCGEYSKKIGSYGIECISYDIQRDSLNPLKELLVIESIYKAIKPLNLDMLQTTTVKPNIYGTFAATRAKVPVVVNLIEGLGTVYVENSLKNSVLRFIQESLYKKAFRLSKKVIFVNSDDPVYMMKKGMITEDKVKVIKSVGIDTEEFSMQKITDISSLKKSLGLKDEIVVLMVARAIWYKGVREFYEMASRFDNKKVRFIFVGGVDKGFFASASEEFLQNGDVQWLGHRDDIKELTALCDIYVLPTSYREGVPKTLLEAASMSKPIVTTDAVGCRDVVDDGINGYLVPVKNNSILYEKIKVLVENPILRKEMGEKGREKAVKEFDIKNIVSQYTNLYESLFPIKDEPSMERST